MTVGHALYYGRDGQPMDWDEWHTAMESAESRRVAIDRLASGHVVSTVWIGIDHRFGPGPPLIFETMVFPPDAEGTSHTFEEQEMARYSTEAEALAGHEAMVQKWIAKGTP